MRGAVHVLEEVNYVVSSPFCRATCSLTGPIAVNVPIRFSTADSAIFRKTRLLLLPLSQRPLHEYVPRLSANVTVRDGMSDSAFLCTFSILRRPDVTEIANLSEP